MREPTSTLFTDVVVFDGTDFHSGTRDVLVREGRIERVASHGEIQASQDTRTVNGSGHTLTPGFIDCHVHLTVSNAGSLAGFAEPFSTQFYRSVDNMRRTLDAGVTTVRDAGGADAGLKHSLATGLVRGPRVKLSVSTMSQTGGHGDSWLLSGACSPMLAPHTGRPDGVADGPDGVRRKAREILRAGADQIKICSTGGVLSPDDDPQHSQFGPDEIEVIVAEARAQGAYVMSHAQGAPGRGREGSSRGAGPQRVRGQGTRRRCEDRDGHGRGRGRPRREPRGDRAHGGQRDVHGARVACRDIHGRAAHRGTVPGQPRAWRHGGSGPTPG